MQNLNSIYQQDHARHRAAPRGSPGCALRLQSPGETAGNAATSTSPYSAPLPDSWSFFVDALEELPTLLEFDLVYVNDSTSPELVAEHRKGRCDPDRQIDRKGPTEPSSLALKRLSEAMEDYKKLALDSIRDGVIQRFQFCTELAWKTTREYV